MNNQDAAHSTGDEQESEALQICPSCMSPNFEEADFCIECQAPIGATAGIDPIKSIWARGYLYREIAQGKPSDTVLIGSWLVLGPLALTTLLAIAFGAYCLVMGFRPEWESGGGWLVSGLISAVVGIPAAIILYRCTTRSVAKIEALEVKHSPEEHSPTTGKESQ